MSVDRGLLALLEAKPGKGPELAAFLEQGRQAHLDGQIPAALGNVAADLLADAPNIRMIDVLVVK